VDVTFLIQGPLTSEISHAIPIYKRIGKVVVSCWNTDDSRLIQLAHDHKCKLAINPMLEDNRYNFQNVSYHIDSTLAGLDQCGTDWVIKTRADEYFTNPQPVIDSMHNDPDKLTVVNFLFRKDLILHPSDHIMGGRTEDIVKMFEGAREFIKDYSRNERVTVDKINLNKDYTYRYLTAEMTFCINWLKLKGVDIIDMIKDKSVAEVEAICRTTMKKHYSLVRASELGNFLFRFKSNTKSGGPTAFTYEEQFLDFTDVPSIKSLDELEISSLRKLE